MIQGPIPNSRNQMETLQDLYKCSTIYKIKKLYVYFLNGVNQAEFEINGTSQDVHHQIAKYSSCMGTPPPADDAHPDLERCVYLNLGFSDAIHAFSDKKN